MTRHTFARPLTWMATMGALAVAPHVYAATGFMAFLTNGPTGTAVTTGTAESYMRAGRDWDGATLSGGIAMPTIVQSSVITTFKQGTDLHMKFSIPDATTVKSAGGALACGDQVIVQFGPANATATTLVQGQEFRFEIVIIGSQIPSGVQKRLPRPSGDPLVGHWKNTLEASTSATVTPTGNVGSPYTFELVVPLSEIGNPAGDVGVAVALINDLGHSHGSNINEASGTAFPVGMGLTPESDPGLTCGALPSGETANGNWINPSTWGVGYTAVSATPAVTFDQGPQGWISRAIRIGRCSITDFNQIPEVSANDWVSVQTAMNTNWYKYNGASPCKMTIWMNATVSPPGTTQRRFLAVWGRPGIAPQGWYFAGVTNAVTVASPTTAVSFVWGKPPAVTFSDHPCLRVYVLPATFTPAQQQAVTDLMNDTTAAGNSLTAFETAFGVSGGMGTAAQMNFANYENGSSCSESACMPTASLTGTQDGLLARWSPFATVYAQPQTTDRRGDERSTLIRIVAHGFGVAEPQGGKPYMFIEDVGGLGWAVSNQTLAQVGAIPMKVQVSNPAITERMFVNGQAVDVKSPNRRILVVPVVSVVPGTPVPNVDLSALNRAADTPLTPGQTIDSQVVIAVAGYHAYPWWWWIVLLLILIVAVVLYLVRRASTP